MKILIVEDDLIIQELMKTILTEFGECTATTTEEEAVELFIQAHSEEKPFDLVTLDIMLPGGNGRNILKRIRGFERKEGINGFDGVKIIMVSALGDKDNVLGSFNDQCEGYLVKPIKRDTLLNQLREMGLIK